MTRKGLAIGSAFALAASSFGLAVPANAAGLADKTFVSLTPTDGTDYTVLEGTGVTFKLSANEASTVSVGDLKFLVTDPDEEIEPTKDTEGRALHTFTTSDKFVFTHATDIVELDTVDNTLEISVGDQITFGAAFDGTTANTLMTTVGSVYEVLTVASDGFGFTFKTDAVEALALTANVTSEALTVGGAVTVVREARDADDNSFVIDSGQSDATNVEDIVLQPTVATDFSITVTAWMDANDNDKIDSTEYTSPTRTVSFVDPEDVVITTSLKTGLIGAVGNLTATVTTDPVLNGEQLASDDWEVKFTRQGVDGYNVDKTFAWDDDDKEFSFVLSSAATAVNGTITGVNDSSSTFATSGAGSGELDAGSYTARAYLDANADAKSNVATAALAAAVADNVVAVVSGSDDIQYGASTTDAAATVVKVRKGVNSVVITTVTEEADGDPAANVQVQATISNESGAVKVNGVAVDNADTVLVTTDANGVATFTVTNASAANGNRVQLDFTSQTISADADQAAIDLKWETTAYEMMDLNDNGIAHSGTMVTDRQIAEGGSYTFDFAVVDQWGGNLPDGHRLRLATTGRTVGTTFHTISDGRVSVTVADGGITTTTNGAVTVTATVEQADGTAEIVSVEEFVGGEHGTISMDIYDSTNKITLEADASGNADDADDIADITLIEQDRRVGNVAVVVPDAVVTIDGSVADTTTANAAEGAVVTIWGHDDFLFNVGDRYEFGRMTFIVDDTSGNFEVDVLSNTAVTDSTIYIQSMGGEIEERDVTFNAVGKKTGTQIDIDVPSNVSSSSAFKVTATVMDKWGNPVDTTGDMVEVVYDGPGVVLATIATDTNTKGQVAFSVLLGSNDKGAGSVTVSYDQNDDGDFTGTKKPDIDVVKTVTFTVGATSTADTKVNAGSFKGYVAIYAKGHEGKRLSAKVGNDWVVVPALASNFVRVVEYTGAGYTIAVRIYIDRVLVDTITVTTK